MLKPTYIMVGGFLGAGKTTAILRVAELLRARSRRIGLITNDQSTGLVDTSLLASHGFPVQEIAGGCFCCKFNSLVEAADRLTEDAKPDVFIAEPVGSCTDLRSTVSYPMQRLYGDNFQIAPLSVLADPIRAQRILGLRSGNRFSPKVIYIYEKQLEEADLVVINKSDLVNAAEIDELKGAVNARWPHVRVLAMSTRTGNGLEDWLAAITSERLVDSPAMDIDYDLYADGEALLGWLNLSATLTGPEFDGNSLLRDIADRLQDDLRGQVVDIGHLKMTLVPDEGPDIAVINLVHRDASAEMSHALTDSLTEGQLLLNLRAEGEPEQLQRDVAAALSAACAAVDVELRVQDVSAFRPSRPMPVHRLARV